MKTLSIEMPVVQACSAEDCGYNVDKKCHARAITVGDFQNPACDTFFVSPESTNAVNLTAGVGACKVASCKFNKDFECMTDSIRVGHAGGQVKCLTFSPNS